MATPAGPIRHALNFAERSTTGTWCFCRMYVRLLLSFSHSLVACYLLSPARARLITALPLRTCSRVMYLHAGALAGRPPDHACRWGCLCACGYWMSGTSCLRAYLYIRAASVVVTGQLCNGWLLSCQLCGPGSHRAASYCCSGSGGSGNCATPLAVVVALHVRRLQLQASPFPDR